MDTSATAPRVSVIMANYNGAAHIAAAVRSVLRQTETSLELIVSDDGSTDDSLDRADSAAAGDPRLVIIRGGGRTGPAAARNRALRRARGQWMAIVDNDDYIHPERLARLLNAAEADDADIAADDLLVFYEDNSAPPHPHLHGQWAAAANWVSAAAYERTNRLLGPRPALGYLKPVFRRSLEPHYNETMCIGEDSDLVLRLLIGGARMRVYPELGYFYRKHAASISHRLDETALDAFDKAYAGIAPGSDKALQRTLKSGAATRADVRAFTRFIAALKQRNVRAALNAALARPTALWLLKEPVAARLRPKKHRAAQDGRSTITLLSRQRIVGATNGSSAYVLAIAGALRAAGYAVDYIGASPKIFGRWAVLRLRPEIGVFARYMVRGGVKAGRFVLSTDPKIWWASVLAVLDFALRKLGIPVPGLSEPAVYAPDTPPTRADALFVARHAASGACAILCDYAFLSPFAPYALSPLASSLIIMHDLMSARVSDTSAEQRFIKISAEREFELLGLADAILAIQPKEAEQVRNMLPNSSVITALHATSTAPAPQPGADDTALFVGSNTAPNVVGLEWFFRDIWPAIRAKRPNAQLKIAGSVARALGAPPEGVTMLGVIDLAPLYAEAGVVISPLYTGSGLKIKLIEALAAGKAMVGTSITTQGVETRVAGAMALADDPAQFAADVVTLLQNRELRLALATKALACAREYFSAEACFRDMVSFIDTNRTANPQNLLQRAAAPRQ